MARIPFVRLAVLAGILVVPIIPVLAQDDTPQRGASTREEGATSTCKVYGLSHLGSDPTLGAWIAKTIPEVIQPGTWRSEGGKQTISYHPTAKILVICHTAKAHAEVEAFLKGVKKAVAHAEETGPAAAVATPASPVEPAQFTTPATPAAVPESVRVTKSAKAAKAHPKHLFHLIVDGLEINSDEQQTKLKNFTLRYEGEGIIDSNVAKLIRSLNRSSAASTESGPTCVPALPFGVYRSGTPQQPVPDGSSPPNAPGAPPPPPGNTNPLPVPTGQPSTSPRPTAPATPTAPEPRPTTGNSNPPPLPSGSSTLPPAPSSPPEAPNPVPSSRPDPD